MFIRTAMSVLKMRAVIALIPFIASMGIGYTMRRALSNIRLL